MIKIAFFDVDGTLIKLGTKELSDKTEKALTKLRQNNVLLCMATGRSYPTIPHFQGIDFDVLLTFNGSYVKSGEKIIFKNPLHNEDKNQIIQNLKNMKRAIAISNENFIVTNGTDEDLAQYFAIGNETMIISDDFDKLSQNDIYQIMCAGRKEEYEKILQGTKNAQVAAWWDKAVDIIPANGGKGNAVNAVLKYYGFSKEEAIAFGDGQNDIEMLEAVGTGVAMGNAKYEVKERADVVCKSVEEDGVYYYCLEDLMSFEYEVWDGATKLHPISCSLLKFNFF